VIIAPSFDDSGPRIRTLTGLLWPVLKNDHRTKSSSFSVIGRHGNCASWLG
jgi:hypothetical protein